MASVEDKKDVKPQQSEASSSTSSTTTPSGNYIERLYIPSSNSNTTARSPDDKEEVKPQVSIGRSSTNPSRNDIEQLFGMAQKEMDYRTEMFNKLAYTCFNKCIEKRYKEPDLYIGENSCVDRCVSKYYQVTNLIGHLLAANKPM